MKPHRLDSGSGTAISDRPAAGSKKRSKMTETVRIAMWSGPRNISTAMMRSWSSRRDCRVVDEPFYAAYLAETGLDHPMRAEILASQSQDWDLVASDCASACDAAIIFQKHMSQHMVAAAPLGWMSACRHAFLIRPPEEVAASFSAKWDAMTAEDLGFRRQSELFDHICQLTGAAPPVVMAADVLQDPGGMMRALCSALRVDWDPAMLQWTAGRHPDDGVWGAHWYNAVIGSTGFAPPSRRPPAVPEEHLAIVDACRPHFESMARHCLKA